MGDHPRRKTNKRRDLFTRSASECADVYSYIYETYCKGRADYGLIRSKVGYILSTERGVLKALYEIDIFIREHCASGSRS
mgnify:CR=1 FL=1